jgi:hypothetical protein
VKSDVRVHSVQSCRSRRHQTQQSRKRTVVKAGETQIEPGHIWFYPSDGTQQAGQVARLSETPTANDPKTGQLIGWRGKIISQYRQFDAALLPKVLRYVKTIFVESMATRGK